MRKTAARSEVQVVARRYDTVGVSAIECHRLQEAGHGVAFIVGELKCVGSP
jgi:hypothetical protein